MDGQEEMIVRYKASERINHWILAIAFILSALSGLALFHPSLFFLTNFFGGGPWTRILHPWLGIVVLVTFGLLAVRFWRDNYLTANDWRWIGQIRDVISNREERLPEVGRYNAGQKLLFWTLAISIVVLFGSGIVIWYQYFAWSLPIWARRLGSVVHAVSAFVMVEAIIVHIYASIWVRGSNRAMVRGTVTPAWARQHHLGWYRRISKGQQG